MPLLVWPWIDNGLCVDCHIVRQVSVADFLAADVKGSFSWAAVQVGGAVPVGESLAVRYRPVYGDSSPLLRASR